MNCLFQNPRDLLRERAMFGSRAATKRFLEVIGHVRAYKNAFPICHLSNALSDRVGIFTLQ
jgi:hypothetical protein